MVKVPRELSPGEELLALHLRANHIAFEREICPIPGRKWRVDFMISRLVVEVEGGAWQIGRHQRPGGFEADAEKYNALAFSCFTLFRYTTAMVKRGDAIRDILDFIGGRKQSKIT